MFQGIYLIVWIPSMCDNCGVSPNKCDCRRFKLSIYLGRASSKGRENETNWCMSSYSWMICLIWDGASTSGNRKNLRERDTFLWITSHGSVLTTRVFCLRHKFLNVLVNSPRSPVSFVFLLLFKSQFVRQIHCWRFLNSWWTPRSVVYLKHSVRDNSQFCWMIFPAINLHLQFQIIYFRDPSHKS